MDIKKQNGSYFTPHSLSDFLIKHIFEHYELPKSMKVLEPSCGDGRFISSLLKNTNQSFFYDLTLVEKRETDLAECLSLINHDSDRFKVSSHLQDYLVYQKEDNESYSLILGNPPYINKKMLSKKQINLCQQIHETAGLAINLIKNIWPSFLLSAALKLEENGVMCLVLPAELLQVNYAKELRRFILENFDKIEIFTFNELIFEKIEQDVIVLIAAKKYPNEFEKGISFYHVNKLDDLKVPHYAKKNSNVHRKTLDKWTNYILDDTELEFVDSMRKSLKTIEHYCDKSSAGIVTAANSYFIVSQDEICNNRLHKYSEAILSKSIDIKNTINFSTKHHVELQNQNKRVNFIMFPDIDLSDLNEDAQKYINYGSSLKIDKRYKCKLREHWYHVPNVWISEGFFTKRSHLFPRLILNSAQVRVTDSFYRICMKKGYSIKNLIFSYYNSLTFVLAELEGRYYGGGVLELTPNEFKRLAIPYCDFISDNEFNTLESMFNNNSSLSDILEYTDKILLEDRLNVSKSDILKLKNIRESLVSRRLKQ